MALLVSITRPAQKARGFMKVLYPPKQCLAADLPLVLAWVLPWLAQVKTLRFAICKPGRTAGRLIVNLSLGKGRR